MQGRALRLAGVGLLASLVAAAAAPAAGASRLTEITIPAHSAEIADLWLQYPNPPKARVLLPDAYDQAKAYPLLILLGGLDNNYATWSTPGAGDVQEIAKGFKGIIVMPEGADGWYTDWWNGGRRGAPSWESYILDDVIPQILERYRIRPERRWHALAGASMGGLGAAYLGGRLPGFFGSVAVISGLVEVKSGQGVVESAASEALAGAPSDPEAALGPPGGFYEQGHNPAGLAANMAQTRVFMATGDGTPATDSSPGATAGGDGAKEGGIIKPASDDYASALAAAGVNFVYQVHAGQHDWPNFHREVRDAIAWGLFEPVDEHPTSWVNDTVATHGKLWGFAYRFDVPPDRIVRFRRSGGRLTVGAAGSAVTLTTDGGCVFHVATPASVEGPWTCANAPAPGATAPAQRLRVGYFGRRLHFHAVLVRLHTTTGTLRDVTVELRRGGHVAARALVRRVGTRRRDVVLRGPGGARIASGRYRLIVRRGRTVIVRRTVGVGKINKGRTR